MIEISILTGLLFAACVACFLGVISIGLEHDEHRIGDWAVYAVSFAIAAGTGVGFLLSGVL